MIALDETRARITALNHFTSVSDVLSATDAMKNFDAIPPAAYVHIGRETAGKNINSTGGRLQRVNTLVSVLFVHGAERADGERVDVMEVTRGMIIQTMTGWMPTGAAEPLGYSGYAVVGMQNGLIWGECVFATSWVLQMPT